MERLSLLFGVYTAFVSLCSVGKFLQFLFRGATEPSVVLTDDWRDRMLIDFGLTIQFIFLHIWAKAPIFQDIFTKGNYFTNSFGTFYASISSLSLYVRTSCFISISLVASFNLLAPSEDLSLELLSSFSTLWLCISRSNCRIRGGVARIFTWSIGRLYTGA